ncbi:MAG: anthranilate synthase component I family protein, partial [Caulobacteraceae bacterium]
MSTCIADPPTILKAPWREPACVAAALAGEPFALCLLSDGAGERGRWSYVAARPAATLALLEGDLRDPVATVAALLGPARPIRDGGPPFQGGAAGVAAYELGDRIEPLGLTRLSPWPDLACARYETLIAFDHREREVLAIGPGQAEARAALGWLDAPSPPAAAGPLAATLERPDPAAHERAVAEVTERIAAGEFFQANIARAWTGTLAAGRRPFDLFARLAESSPAPFALYLRLPGLALVSNSPERFLQVRREDGALIAEARPIKGTVRRGASPQEDARLVAWLAASIKDRAENLMIVDLMRNDLARTAEPGGVAVTELFAVERFANVSHLVSTVRGRLAPSRTALEAFAAAFPPGSITGAPKLQAMKTIARLEPPRGPFFGAG